MKEIISVILIFVMLCPVMAYADNNTEEVTIVQQDSSIEATYEAPQSTNASNLTDTPQSTLTPVEVAREKGLTESDWEMFYHWNTSSNKKYKGITVKEKYKSYLVGLISRGYLEEINRSHLEGFSYDHTNSDFWFSFGFSDNTLSNEKTIDDTWLNGRAEILEWNDHMIFCGRVSNEKISEANGVYTFNGFSNIIMTSDTVGYDAVSYVQNDKILPNQDVTVLFGKESSLENPEVTVSVAENGEEIFRCNLNHIEAVMPAYYTYFIDAVRGEQELIEYKKDKNWYWEENGKQYRVAKLNKHPEVIAYFSFKETEEKDTDIAKEVSSNGEFTVDYYIVDSTGERKKTSVFEILMISGDKNRLSYFKWETNDKSVPSAQSIMIGKDQYVTLTYEKVKEYYDSKDNNNEYTLVLSCDDNAFLKMLYGTYDNPEYKVQLDIDDLHITKSYDEMTEYSENMPEYWRTDSEGRFDSSPEGRKLLEEIGQEHTVYYADGHSKTFVDNNKYKEIKVKNTSAGLEINLNDENINFPDAQPYIDNNDRTQVPIRAVAEMLDNEVKWDSKTETVSIINANGDTVMLTIGSEIMTINNTPVQMDTTAIIKDERTYIPIRFVAEAMGLTVKWIQ